jgi:hypothetical protein
MRNKFWNHVEEHLKNRDTTMYFLGRTLSVGLGPKSGIALNLDGKGFIFGRIRDGFDDKIYQPPYITEMVVDIYRETKGEAALKEQLQDISGMNPDNLYECQQCMYRFEGDAKCPNCDSEHYEKVYVNEEDAE